jgi:TonB family protein
VFARHKSEAAIHMPGRDARGQGRQEPVWPGRRSLKRARTLRKNRGAMSDWLAIGGVYLGTGRAPSPWCVRAIVVARHGGAMMISACYRRGGRRIFVFFILTSTHDRVSKAFLAAEPGAPGFSILTRRDTLIDWSECLYCDFSASYTWNGTTYVHVPSPMEEERPVDSLSEWVDRCPSPTARYPETLRKAGIEGRVIAECVLDTLGHAEPRSVHPLMSPHDSLSSAGIEWILGCQFRPARVWGRAVRVLIQVPVDFKINNAGSGRRS